MSGFSIHFFKMFSLSSDAYLENTSDLQGKLSMFCNMLNLEVDPTVQHLNTADQNAWLGSVEQCLYVPSALQHKACHCLCGLGPELNPGIAPGTDLSSHLSGLQEQK